MLIKSDSPQSCGEDVAITAQMTAQSFPTRSELLPIEIDQIAKTEPRATFLSVPSDDGYKAITFRQYANAIDGTAYWLEKHLGKGDKSRSLAWFGAGGSDVRYAILLLAAVKAGYYVSLMVVTLCLESSYLHIPRCFSIRRATALMPM